MTLEQGNKGTINWIKKQWHHFWLRRFESLKIHNNLLDLIYKTWLALDMKNGKKGLIILLDHVVILSIWEMRSWQDLKNYFKGSPNLEEGTGDPWAGHDRLNADDEDLMTPEEARSVENFGADPPTGSEIFGWSDKPIRWDRRALSRAWQAESRWRRSSHIWSCYVTRKLGSWATNRLWNDSTKVSDQ